MKRSLLLFVLVLTANLAWAVEPDEILENPVLEQRAREISKQLRCVVCLNQDIDSSNAGVARTMRILLRERLVAGDTDKEVLAFFVERYGDFVLFRPPLKGTTYLLWFAPFLIFGLGAGAVAVAIRRANGPSARSAALTLSDEERREIAAILKADRESE